MSDIGYTGAVVKLGGTMAGGHMTANGIFTPRKPVSETMLLAKRAEKGGVVSLDEPSTWHDVAINLGERPSERRQAHILEGTRKEWTDSIKTLPETFKHAQRKALEKAYKMTRIDEMVKVKDFPKEVKDLLLEYWPDRAKVDAIYDAAFKKHFTKSEPVRKEYYPNPPITPPKPRPYNGMWNIPQPTRNYYKEYKTEVAKAMNNPNYPAPPPAAVRAAGGGAEAIRQIKKNAKSRI